MTWNKEDKLKPRYHRTCAKLIQMYAEHTWSLNSWLQNKTAQQATSRLLSCDKPWHVDARNIMPRLIALRWMVDLWDNSINGDTLGGGTRCPWAVWHGLWTVLERGDHLPRNERIQTWIKNKLLGLKGESLVIRDDDQFLRRNLDKSKWKRRHDADVIQAWGVNVVTVEHVWCALCPIENRRLVNNAAEVDSRRTVWWERSYLYWCTVCGVATCTIMMSEFQHNHTEEPQELTSKLNSWNKRKNRKKWRSPWIKREMVILPSPIIVLRNCTARIAALTAKTWSAQDARMKNCVSMT